MLITPTRLSLAIAAAGLLTLAACGGGGGGSASSGATINGVAATGAAFTDATITVKDSTGATVGTASVGTDGSYTVTLSAGAKAPFVLTASRTNAEGVSESLVSVLPTASSTSATVNITPVSTLIAARLSTSGDPSKLAEEIRTGSATVDSTTVDAKVTEVKTILAPILTATGTSSFDPLGGTFSANGTGYDRLLDSIKVTIIPDSSTTTNIEIGVKQQQPEGTAPLAVQFSSSQSTSTITTNNNITSTAIGGTTVSSGNLLPSGTSEKIAAHLQQLTNCYALAPSARVPSGTTAADIAATECTSAFYGNDPANFKSNGKTVSATGAFSGIFSSGVQNVVFSQGQYEFTRANGDIVISYKSKTAAGAETYDTFALREDTDGKLKQIGNQYDYGGGVSAYHQIRRFPALSQSASNYYSTGYNISIPKNAAYSYVAVTTPRGNTLIYKPQTGYDNLQLVKGWSGTADAPDFTSASLTGTSFVRIRSEYVDQGNTANPGASSEGTRLFFVSTPFTESEIAQIPAQGVWTLKYYLSGTPNTLVATQYYKTRSRALTIAELRTQTWATLTDAQIADLQSASIPYAAPPSPAGQIPVTDGRTSFSLAYTVPTNALPPTSLQIWGKYTTNGWTSSTSFSDTAAVASTARSGSVACANAGGGDAHCVSGGFANPTRLNGIHLWSRDTTGREFANFYAWYQL